MFNVYAYDGGRMEHFKIIGKTPDNGSLGLFQTIPYGV